MEQKQKKIAKQIKSFWALFILFVFAALVGGIIIGVSYNNILQDEVSSFSFKIHKDATKSKTPTTSTIKK